jgi:hypothetical protein
MNFWDSFIIIVLLLVFNGIVYMIFNKYLYSRADAGMKFLTVNISKDLIWLIISLLIIDKTKANFLFIVICFIIGSLLIYYPIIKRINKS